MGHQGRVAWAAAALVVLAACGSGPTQAPPAGSNAAGGGLPSSFVESLARDEAGAEKLLAEYATRFSQGYPIYPGDQVKFVVLGNAEVSFSARIPVEGYINYPLIGRLQLVGRTLEEVRGELVQRLSQKHLVNPDVSVLIEDYSRKSVYILGAVNHPRDYDIPSGRMTTLLRAISQAGGFAPDAEKRAVIIFRPKQIGSLDPLTFSVDVVALMRLGQGKDPVLLPDDVVMVPARERVSVFGQVINGGQYVLPADQPTTVSQAISMAGGFTRIAAEGAVRLIRTDKDGKRTQYLINVDRILDGFPEEDVPLQPGDVIFVPESFF